MGVDGRKVYEAKAQELGVPFADLSKFKPEPSAINVVPEHVAKRHTVLPLKKDGTMLWVAMSDPGKLAGVRRPAARVALHRKACSGSAR